MTFRSAEHLQSNLSPEALMPRLGIETVEVSPRRNPEKPEMVTQADIPLDIEPLFEQDGVKALAQVSISIKDGQQAEKFYIVDVSGFDAVPGKGYADTATQEPINYLVVPSRYFTDNADANYSNSRTVVGGEDDQTRLGTAGSKNNFGVTIQGGSHKPLLTIIPNDYRTASFEVSYRRDERDPAMAIANHRELREAGQLEATYADESTSLQERFKESVKRLFRRKQDDSNYQENEALFHDTAISDLKFIDDLNGLNVENTRVTAAAIKHIEKVERDQALAVAETELRQSRIRNAVGCIAALGAQLGIVALDAKFNGLVGDIPRIFDKNHTMPASEATADVAEVIGLGLATAAYVSTSLKVSKITGLLKGGLKKRVPKAETMDLSGAEDEQTLIRTAAKNHEAYLKQLHKATADAVSDVL